MPNPDSKRARLPEVLLDGHGLALEDIVSIARDPEGRTVALAGI